VDFDKELESVALGDEDFVQAVKAWEESSEGEADKRGKKLENELDELAVDN